MYIVSSIKTFQILWNVWNTSENLLKFVIFDAVDLHAYSPEGM